MGVRILFETDVTFMGPLQVISPDFLLSDVIFGSAECRLLSSSYRIARRRHHVHCPSIPAALSLHKCRVSLIISYIPIISYTYHIIYLSTYHIIAYHIIYLSYIISYHKHSRPVGWSGRGGGCYFKEAKRGLGPFPKKVDE